MRSTEIVNARLLSVTGGVGDDDWEQAAAAGTSKYQGPDVGVLYDEQRQRILTGSGPRTHVWRSLNVREELGVDWQPGDVITFCPTDLPDPFTAIVREVEDPHTQRGEAGEVRLILDLQP